MTDVDASAIVSRTGSRVAVTRVEFHNDEGILFAAGTGTYIVG
jgi:acyl-coenzyme A thioesterase PaaI-like protein